MDLLKELELSGELILNYPRKKIGIFGGTFDPVHSGHIDMALKVLKEFSLTSMVFLPCGAPPHKNHHEIASKYDRLHMVSLCVYEQRGLSVSDAEVKRNGVTYTIDTIKEFEKKCVDTDLFFIIGADTIFELEAWRDLPGICARTTFICVRRYKYDNLQVAAQAAMLREKYNAKILISEYTGMAVSSSEVRDRIREQKSIARLVPKAVEEYIEEHGLYK